MRVSPTGSRLTTILLRIGIRAMPWVVSAGAIVAGSWFFSALIPIASHSALAAVSIGGVLFRAVAALAAVSAGAFALAAGLEGRWLSNDVIRRRRFAGLAALGASGMAVGTFIVAGRLAGISIAQSLAVAGAAGVLAGLSAWSTWSMRRQVNHDAPPSQLGAPRPTEDWFTRDRAREKTPAT